MSKATDRWNSRKRPKVPGVRKSWQSRLSGSPVLLISIVIHLLLGLLALSFIVQRIEEKRKLNFAETPVTNAGATAQVDQKIQMTKKRNAMSVPEINQRITTSGLSPISLPEIALPSEAPNSSSSKMTGTALSSNGLAAGTGGVGLNSTEVGPISIDVSGVASAFGLSNGRGLGLEGRFYDLKQMQNREPSNMQMDDYPGVIAQFVNNGWPDDYFKKYFVGPRPLYLPQLFMPYMVATDGPKAFALQDLVKPMMWVVLYHGKIRVPHAGTYRFVGAGDDLCEVAINRKMVLEASWRWKIPPVINHPHPEHYDFSFPVDLPMKQAKIVFLCGDWVTLSDTQAYDMQVLVGEWPGGFCGFWLMVEEKGHVYKKTADGLPILPLFKVSNVKMPSVDVGCPPYSLEDLGWKMDDDNDFSQ